MIELYYGPTANGQRAAVILEESELPFRRHPVDLAKGEHLAADFLALNPVGMTPVLVDGDVVINESRRAVAYLYATYGDDTQETRAQELNVEIEQMAAGQSEA